MVVLRLRRREKEDKTDNSAFDTDDQPFTFAEGVDADAECKRILATLMAQKDDDGNDTKGGGTELFSPEQALLLPSWYNDSIVKLMCQDMLLSFAGEDGVIPKRYDDIVTGLALPLFISSGPPAYPGRMYSLRSPNAATNVCKNEKLLAMKVYTDPKTKEKKYSFGTASSVFKGEHSPTRHCIRFDLPPGISSLHRQRLAEKRGEVQGERCL